jgi:hypothetical protein
MAVPPRPVHAALGVVLLVGVWPYAYVLGLHPASRDAVIWMSRSAVWADGWLGWVFGSSHFVGWRPLTALSFAADSLLGAGPLPYRATDLALHLGCAAALFAVHRRLVPGRTAWGGVAAAAMLLVHPVAGLVVPHLARRSYPLSTLLALLAVLACLSDHRRRTALAAALVGCAAMAHEAGFVAAPAIALLAALRAPPGARIGAAWPLLAVAGTLAAVRAAVLRGGGGYDVDVGERVLPILASSVTGLLGLEPMRTGTADVPGAAVLAIGLALAGALSAPLLQRRDEGATAAAFAWAWLLGLLAVYAPQGVFFPRQLYVPVAAYALLVGLAVSAAAASDGTRRIALAAAAGLAFAAAAWQSPVLLGPDPVQQACWRAHDALVRDLQADLADLPPRAIVDVVAPYHRRPSFEALRARDDEGRGRFAGRQALAWASEVGGTRFGTAVLYAVDPPLSAPAARVDQGPDGPVVVLDAHAELVQASGARVDRDSGATTVTPGRSEVEGRPSFLYVHDGIRGRLVAEGR